MKDRVLVTGGTGMLGCAIIRALRGSYKTICVSRTTKSAEANESFVADLSDPFISREIIKKAQPDIVVHCAALIDVEECERDYVKAYGINARAPEYLANALGPDGLFIYISTDSVFDGMRGRYSEDDDPRPLNNYSKTKLEGERLIKDGRRNHMIIRSNMIGHRPARGGSLAEWVTQNLRSGTRINMFTDVMISPLDVTIYAGLIKKLIALKYLGCIHLGSHDGLSKYDLGCRLAKRLGMDSALISPRSVEDACFLAKRPKDTTLNVSKAEKILGSMPYVDQVLDLWCASDRKSVPMT